VTDNTHRSDRILAAGLRFSVDDVRQAAAESGLDGVQVNRLVEALGARSVTAARTGTAARTTRFDLVHLLWYAGALIVITSMGLFSTLAFSAMGGPALTVTSVVYAAVFTVAGHYLWYRRALRTPGGLLVAIAVSMAPLAVYGVQDAWDVWGEHGDPGHYRGFFIWIKGSFVFMELAAILAGLLALRFYPFPFTVAIIAVAVWFLSMDLTPWLFQTADLTWANRRAVSIWFGLAVLIAAWFIDVKRNQRGDFAFWLHLAGLAAFWGGLSMSHGSTEFARVVYCMLNVALIAFSVFLGRRTYAVFGTLGVSLYLGYLASVVFENSLLFPFALSLIGIVIIALGLFLHRKQTSLSAWMSTRLPGAIKRLRPPHASLPMELP
jgi:hypothetical protein